MVDLVFGEKPLQSHNGMPIMKMTKEIFMDFGERLKNLRIEKGLTQEAVANALCVTKQAVSKWENGASFPDVAYLGALADLMGVNIDYLLTGNDNVKIEKQIEIVEKEKIVEVEKEVIKEKPVETKKHYTKEEASSIAYRYLMFRRGFRMGAFFLIPFFVIDTIASLIFTIKYDIKALAIATGVIGIVGIIVIIPCLIYSYKQYKKEERYLRKKYGDLFVWQVSQYKTFY